MRTLKNRRITFQRHRHLVWSSVRITNPEVFHHESESKWKCFSDIEDWSRYSSLGVVVSRRTRNKTSLCNFETKSLEISKKPASDGPAQCDSRCIMVLTSNFNVQAQQRIMCGYKCKLWTRRAQFGQKSIRRKAAIARVLMPHGGVAVANLKLLCSHAHQRKPVQ